MQSLSYSPQYKIQEGGCIVCLVAVYHHLEDCLAKRRHILNKQNIQISVHTKVSVICLNFKYNHIIFCSKILQWLRGILEIQFQIQSETQTISNCPIPSYFSNIISGDFHLICYTPSYESFTIPRICLFSFLVCFLYVLFSLPRVHTPNYPHF